MNTEPHTINLPLFVSALSASFLIDLLFAWIKESFISNWCFQDKHIDPSINSQASQHESHIIQHLLVQDPSPQHPSPCLPAIAKNKQPKTTATPPQTSKAKTTNGNSEPRIKCTKTILISKRCMREVVIVDGWSISWVGRNRLMLSIVIVGLVRFYMVCISSPRTNIQNQNRFKVAVG